MKRILVVFLGIFFAIPAAYAENPFADDEITVKESTSANSLETADKNTKIVECNGMYKTTPKSYNKIYGSSVYNCSIYEKK